MRILVVSPVLPHLPSHDAARLGSSHLVDQLSERHAVGVVAATAGADTPAGRRWLSARTAHVLTVPARRWRHPLSGRPADGLAALAAAVRRAAGDLRPDVVHLEGSVLAPLARVVAAPSVLACHGSAAPRLDAAGAPWRRLRARLEERVETIWQREWLAGVAACVTDSEDDRRALAAHLPFERIEIIPAGIDTAQYAYRRIADASRLVFTGHLGTARDVEAARRLATGILPLVRRRLPRAELLVAGAGSAAGVRDLAALEGVRVEGHLGDLRPSLWSAAVHVSPLASGVGRATRVLEAMALGTPVVASPASLSGLADVLPGHHVLAAETDAEIADAVTRLLREPIVANTIAHNARDLVERRYTWPTVARRYEALYARLSPARAEVAA